MQITIGQQRNDTCAFNSGCQLTLIPGFGAGYAAWYNLARFSDISFQCLQVFVINFLNTFGSKTAISSTTEKS